MPMKSITFPFPESLRIGWCYPPAVPTSVPCSRVSWKSPLPRRWLWATSPERLFNPSSTTATRATLNCARRLWRHCSALPVCCSWAVSSPRAAPSSVVNCTRPTVWALRYSLSSRTAIPSWKWPWTLRVRTSATSVAIRNSSSWTRISCPSCWPVTTSTFYQSKRSLRLWWLGCNTTRRLGMNTSRTSSRWSACLCFNQQ